jgi:hypothetical protein
MPPPGMAGASFFFGVSATMASVVIMRPATTQRPGGLCHSNDTRSTNGGMPRASQSLSREAAPLDQRGRASLFVNLAGHEMTLLVEMIVDLRVN